MFEWPPEATTDTDKSRKRNVTFFLEGRRRVWLSCRDVDWFIRFLYVSKQLEGVKNYPSDDEGPDTPQPALTPET